MKNRSFIKLMLKQAKRCLVLLLVIACIGCKVNDRESFSFVQMCDPQLGMGGYEHDVETFRQAVRQINDMECAFVLICGDLVHHASDSTFSDFLKIKEGLEKPCYLVAGNHDVGNIPNDSTLAYFRKVLGKDYYSFEKGMYAFIMTNTQLWKNNIGEESADHDSWFRGTLSDMGRKDRSVFVIGHHPLFIKDADEEEAYFNLPKEKRMELLEGFVNNNVVAYLSGHKHETLVNSYHNIQLVSGESTSRNFDKRPLGFRLWEVSPDTISHHFIPLDPL